MRRSSICIAVVLAAACKVYDPLYCDENSPCVDPARPLCDLNGDYPASAGVGRTCIPDPDAGEAADAGNSDGNPGRVDARVFTYPVPDFYWAFDEADVSGSILVAREGSLSGELQGTSLDASGVAGDALVFGGGADHVDFGDVLDDVFAGPGSKFTISVWIKPASLSGDNMILVKAGVLACDPSEQNLQLDLLLLDGLPSFRFWTPTNTHARFLVATTPLVLDGWQHLLVTYDGSIDLGAADRIRLYVDGVPQPLTVTGSIGDFPYDIEATDAHLALGKIVGASGEPCGDEQLMAALDELAVWTSVLSPDDAAEVHARGTTAQPLWPL